MQPSVRRRTFVSVLAALGTAAGTTAGVGATTDSAGATELQPQWTATYADTPSSFEDCVADGDGVVVAGFRGGDGWIVRLDETGEIDWDVTASPADGNGGFEAIARTSSGFVAAGVVEAGQRSGWLVAVDATGEEQWETVIDEPASTLAGVTAVGDSIAAVGRTAGNEPDGVLTVLDNEGEQQFTEQYGPPSSSEFAAVIEDDDELVVAGRVTAGGENDPWLLRIDPDNGEVIGAPSVDGAGATELADVERTESGDVFAVGTAEGGTDGFLARITGSDLADEQTFADAQTLQAISDTDDGIVVGGSTDDGNGIVARLADSALGARYVDDETSVVRALAGHIAVGRQDDDGGGIGGFDAGRSQIAGDSVAPSIVDDPVAWGVRLGEAVDRVEAVASLQTDTPVAGEPVSFDATESLPGDAIERYEWSFDGGSFEALGATPEHTFEDPGEYDVTLRVTTDDERDDETTLTVEVAESSALTATFDIDPEVVVVDEEIQFDATDSGPDARIVEYRWDLDDTGEFEALGPEPTFVYERPQDVVSVNLRVIAENGDRAFASESIEVLEDDELTAVATASPTPQTTGEFIEFAGTESTPWPLIERHEWEWPNGNTESRSITVNFWTDPGTYEATLRVFDEEENSDETTIEFEVLELDAAISLSDDTVEADETISFDANSSTPAERIDTYEWDFNWDREFSADATGKEISHSYDDGGEFTVALRITDDRGNTDVAAETITVEQPELAADFTIDVDDPVVGEEIEFDGGASVPGTTIDAYDWSFQAGRFGGETATGEVVTHEYDSPDEYDVQLEVTDEDGDTDALTRTIEVEEPELEPSIEFDPSSPQAGETIEFDAGESEPAERIDSYEWSFNAGNLGGETATGEVVTHEYDSPGEYDIELTVTDESGATSTTTTTLDVSDDDVVARFTVEPSAPEPGESVTVDASGSEAESDIAAYEWEHSRSFGVDADGVEATFTFDEPGDVDITLRIETEAGGETETTETVAVGEDEDGGLVPPDDDDDDDDGGLGQTDDPGEPPDDTPPDGEPPGDDDTDDEGGENETAPDRDEESEQVAMPDRLPAAAAASLLGGGLAFRVYRRLTDEDDKPKSTTR